MSKKITVIQLLNRTASGEEIPKIVKCNGKKYNYHDYSKNYYYIEDTEECLFDDNIAFLANDEVEILEDNTEEIEELSTYRTFAEYDELAKKCINMNAEQFFYKINELVKAVNKLRKENKK